MLLTAFTCWRIIVRLDSCKQVYSICFAKGSSQDRISEVDAIARLEPVIVGYLPACVIDCIVLPGVRVLRMLENSGREFHPEVEGDNVINSGVAGKIKRCQTNKMYAIAASSNSSYAIFVCMPPDVFCQM